MKSTKKKYPKPIPYYGGKQRIASKIVDLLPPHIVYVEPFCGGCAVLFRKGLSPVKGTHYYKEIINDKNSELINMFRVLQRNQELKHWLECTLFSREEFDRAKMIREDNTASDIEKAWAFFVCLSFSFAYSIGTGFGTNVFGENKPVTHLNRVKMIQETINRIKRVCIENDDAINVIKRWDSPQTCFYCDPPYPGTYQSFYKGYTTDDYKKLLNALKQCQGSFVLSCYAQGLEPKKWKKIEIKASMSAAQGKIIKKINTARIETVFIVDRSKNTKDKLKKYLWSPANGLINNQTSLFDSTHWKQ